MSRPIAALEAEITRLQQCLLAMPDAAVQAGFADDYVDEIETLREEIDRARKDPDF